jgi:Amt family ammonium transporter
MSLKKWIVACALGAAALMPGRSFAEEPAQPAPVAQKATVEQRLADIEAALTNGVLPATAAPVDASTRPLGAAAVPGHNGFMMICAALVLFMTLPGLFLFYGGLVRAKNVLSVAGQCFGMAGMVTIMWWAFGYSLVFGKSFATSCPAIAPFLGGTEFLFLQGVGPGPNTDYAFWISQNVFAMFQMMFAIITPALIVGAIAERMKFSAVMLFSALWMLVVYFPMAHMVWGATGYMNGVWNADAVVPAIDFAGGTVVHMTSGWSALLLCIIIGKRTGFGKQKMMPHSMVLCAVGTGMLWVGWYGFNAGSALAADGIATNAFSTTTLAAATAAFVWGGLEWIIRKHASILGMCSGVVAGLVVITPAAGFCTTTGAMIIGVLAGVVPFVFVTYIKAKFKLDDSLDTFGVHGVGGTLGAIVTGFLASDTANANLVGDYAKKNGLAKLVTDGGLWLVQCKAAAITIVIALVATAAIAFLVKALIGLRPTEEQESQGLDITDHGEDGYAI